MFEDGFIKEVRDLFEKNPELINNIPKSLNSVGYKQIVEFIKEDSKICKKIDTLKEKVYFAHRSLVKRQTTWLKKFEFGLKLNCMHDCNKNINTLLNKVT
jgi:tRNA dimethylallyltransferase